jgi:hypothetical protein
VEIDQRYLDFLAAGSKALMLRQRDAREQVCALMRVTEDSKGGIIRMKPFCKQRSVRKSEMQLRDPC